LSPFSTFSNVEKRVGGFRFVVVVAVEMGFKIIITVTKGRSVVSTGYLGCLREKEVEKVMYMSNG
jgi:hypothetical protein